MKAGKFAISVMHGAGHHYFAKYSDTAEGAEQIRFQMQQRLDHQWLVIQRKRGAKGTAYVWEMKEPQIVGEFSKWPQEELDTLAKAPPSMWPEGQM